MQCSYFDAGLCRSCTLMGTDYVEQLRAKDAECRELLSSHPGIDWMPPVASAESGFRTKAKMVVGGTVDRPTLGIAGPDGEGVDLSRCGVIAPGILEVLPVLSEFIRTAALVPYDIRARRGELKLVHLVESTDGSLLLRFVLRSTESLPRIRKHLPLLRRDAPHLAVVTANLQPEHKAVLEGEEEVVLTDAAVLRLPIGGVELRLGPRSFVQTNAAVATRLYAIAREWSLELSPRTVWDLYCGVGGFALHVAAGAERVTGVEVSEDAVASARLSAEEAGIRNAGFHAADATRFALAQDAAPELVIVNPPRRGIGPELARWLESSGVRDVIYSSCNAVTLATDLERMPSFAPVRAVVLDMFPQTRHYEAMTLLRRR